MREIIVISVGGSLIVPDGIDTNFLKSFRNLVLSQARRNKRFVIICGGGKTARKYQQAANEMTKLRKEDVDWIGIHCTRLNAHLLRTIFYKHAHPAVIKDPTQKVKFKELILIAAGWKPGFSTDFDAVMLAKNVGARRIINLTNVDYVYDKDPKKFRDAVPLNKITWKAFLRLLPKRWSPGMNAPFDPVASREANKFGLEVVILNGCNIRNLRKALDGDKFRGTVIS